MTDSEVQTGNSRARISQHAAKDERDLQERVGGPLGPEFCAGHRYQAVVVSGPVVQSLDVRG